MFFVAPKQNGMENSMINLVGTSSQNQMTTTITLLNLVGSELFLTIDHAERCLEMFITERQSITSLQQFSHSLQQIRGTFALIEITGAAELAETMLQCCANIPEGADENWDKPLSALSSGVFILRRYLENFDNYPTELPELLIPAINELRQAVNVTVLPSSYFADIAISSPPLPHPLANKTDVASFNRLRQMYQIGLLGIIKEENRSASVRMMVRAIDRLQKDLDNEDAARLCWATSAALEAFNDSIMFAFPARKRLFSRVDQQLRKTQINKEPLDRNLMKDLLYTVLLDNEFGPKAAAVVEAFELSRLPINNEMFEEEVAKLKGPGQGAICSFAMAIREELVHTQNTIDFFASEKSDHGSLIQELIKNIHGLIKTLSLVGLRQAETMLKEQIGILKIHQNDVLLNTSILERLADVILHVEGVIINYETNANCDNDNRVTPTLVAPGDNNGNQYLMQGRALAIQESLVELHTIQQGITVYVEAHGDKQYLDKLPELLDEIYGSLLFLNQERAANIIRNCQHYIISELMGGETIPDAHHLDNLADVLASIEFFLETSATGAIDERVLELAEESLAALDVPIIYQMEEKTIQQATPINNKAKAELAPQKATIDIEPPIVSEQVLAITPEPPVLSEPLLAKEPPVVAKPVTVATSASEAPILLEPAIMIEPALIVEAVSKPKPEAAPETVEDSTKNTIEQTKPTGHKNWTLS